MVFDATAIRARRDCWSHLSDDMDRHASFSCLPWPARSAYARMRYPVRCELVLRVSEEYPLQDQIRAQSSGSGEMGEKGNLLDTGEEIFANLTEQGPQFWLNYEQYKRSRAGSAQARVVVEQQAAAVVDRDAAAQDAPAKRPEPPAPD